MAPFVLVSSSYDGILSWLKSSCATNRQQQNPPFVSCLKQIEKSIWNPTFRVVSWMETCFTNLHLPLQWFCVDKYSNKARDSFFKKSLDRSFCLFVPILLYSSYLFHAHKSRLAPEKTHIIADLLFTQKGNRLFTDWVVTACVFLSIPPHSSRLYWPLFGKTCLRMKRRHKNPGGFRRPLRVGGGGNWFWIPNWVILIMDCHRYII